MERQCHHCNAPVPEGAPFCAACGAPQIRVVAPQSAAPQTLTSDFNAPPLPATSPVGRHVVWSAAFKKCLIAAGALILALVLLGMLRLSVLMLLAIPAGGWFAVQLYAREWPVTGGMGARIGAVTGFIAYVIYGIFAAIDFVLHRDQAMSEIKRAFTEAAQRNPNPEAQQLVQKLMTPEGMAVLITLVAVIMLFMFLILCSIGGAIGGATAKNRTPSSS